MPTVWLGSTAFDSQGPGARGSSVGTSEEPVISSLLSLRLGKQNIHVTNWTQNLPSTHGFGSIYSFSMTAGLD